MGYSPLLRVDVLGIAFYFAIEKESKEQWAFTKSLCYLTTKTKG
jgi:hypothetical protein